MYIDGFAGEECVYLSANAFGLDAGIARISTGKDLYTETVGLIAAFHDFLADSGFVTGRGSRRVRLLSQGSDGRSLSGSGIGF